MSRYAQDLQGNLILIAGNADYDVIAPKETSPATAPHTKGSRIFYGNALYEVTANIAVNDALVIGTNITASDDLTTLISDKADKLDLVSVIATGATNTTGAPITAGTYFYLNGEMVKATATITNNEAFTLNTNYEEVPDGALNDLYSRVKPYRYSGSVTFLGQIFAYSNAYEMIIPLPMDTSAYTNITCNEYRPSGQTAITDTNPSVTLYANQVLLKSTVSGFSGYVGKEGICRLSFT